MISLTVRGLDGVLRGLTRSPSEIKKETRRVLGEVGRFVQSEAKRRSPVGPTKSEAKAAEIRFDPRKAPGTLRDSILMEQGRGWVKVGTWRGPAMRYARRIHDKIGWSKRGPGTVKQGDQAGEKYLVRAITENNQEIDRKLDTITVAIERAF